MAAYTILTIRNYNAMSGVQVLLISRLLRPFDPALFVDVSQKDLVFAGEGALHISLCYEVNPCTVILWWLSPSSSWSLFRAGGRLNAFALPKDLTEVLDHKHTDLFAIGLPLDVDRGVPLRKAHARRAPERFLHATVFQLDICYVAAVFGYSNVACSLHDNWFFKCLPFTVRHLKTK